MSVRRPGDNDPGCAGRCGQRPLDPRAVDDTRTAGQGAFKHGSGQAHLDQPDFQGGLPKRHIPGSLHFGPGRDPKTIEDLKEWAKSVPKNKKIVLYCGCCPWDHCPNVRPAFQALKEMGFTNLRILSIPADFRKDWVDKGFPVEKAK